MMQIWRDWAIFEDEFLLGLETIFRKVNSKASDVVTDEFKTRVMRIERPKLIEFNRQLQRSTLVQIEKLSKRMGLDWV
jgi:hypothetical protein